MSTPPQIGPPGSFTAKLTNRVSRSHVRIYRLTGGRLGGRVSGCPVLLLDHVGRKSGVSRVSPLLYLKDDPNTVIVASRGGSDAMPAWWLNLSANPTTTIQIGSRTRSVTAREANDVERESLWPRLVEMYPDYAVYQERTERRIPVIILEPA